MAEPAEGWLDRHGVRLHYLEWRHGTGAVPHILLLHGLSSNARYWERLAMHLGGRRLVALDQRGHGLTGSVEQSDGRAGYYSTEALIDDAAFVIGELEMDRPVVVGHSWGATVALELIGARPAFVSGLAFIDGPVQSAANLFSWDEAQRIMQPPLPRFATFADAVAESKQDFGEAWGADLEAFVKARVMRDGDAFVLTLTAPARLELLRGLYDSQPDVLWPRVDVPACALLALRSFARISRSTDRGVARLREVAPAVRVAWFDTPHDIPLFAPDGVAAEIERIAALAGGDASSEASSGNQLQG